VCCKIQNEELAANVADMLELAQATEARRPDLRSSELEEAVSAVGPRDTLIGGREIESFIARIEESSVHAATGRPLLAGVVQFSSIPFGTRR